MLFFNIFNTTIKWKLFPMAEAYYTHEVNFYRMF